MSEPFKLAFGLDDNEAETLPHFRYYRFADRLRAEDLEGDAPRFLFTKKEWEAVENVQKNHLALSYGKYAGQVLAAKMLRYPLKVMKERV